MAATSRGLRELSGMIDVEFVGGQGGGGGGGGGGGIE